MLRFIFMCLVLFVTAVQAQQTITELPAYSLAYDVKRNPFTDGRDALKLARKSSRNVLIEVGGDWCRWCHIMDRFINDHPRLKARLHQTFVLLKVNVSDVNDNSEFLSVFPKINGYPHMFVTDDAGNILLSQDTTDLRENKAYSEARFMAFFDRWSQVND